MCEGSGCWREILEGDISGRNVTLKGLRTESSENYLSFCEYD